MSEKNREDFQSAMALALPSETGAISALDLRVQLRDLCDSTFVRLSDDSDNIAQGSSHLFLTSAEREKLENLGNGVSFDTHANVLDLEVDSGDAAYATDYDFKYIYSNGWRIHALPLFPAPPAQPNIGADDFPNITGYTKTHIVEKTIAHCDMISPVIQESNTSTRNALTTDQDGTLYKIDNAGVQQAIPVGVKLAANPDNTMLEYQPTGTSWWIELHTGNSRQRGSNGKPFIHNYQIDIGSHPSITHLSGGTL